MADTIQSATEATDPRILRSRRMLMEALARLLIKKEFEDISVQDIADEATLNRATFYLHYPDKNALLQAMATAAAWAVFGAARRWFQTPDRIPAEEMAAKIQTMVMPVILSGNQ